MVKLWKECPERRNYWPLAISEVLPGCTFLGRLHVACVQVKLKTLQSALNPLWPEALAILELPPKTVDGPVDNVSAYGSSPCLAWPAGSWLFFVQVLSGIMCRVAAKSQPGHAASRLIQRRPMPASQGERYDFHPVYYGRDFRIW